MQSLLILIVIIALHQVTAQCDPLPPAITWHATLPYIDGCPNGTTCYDTTDTYYYDSGPALQCFSDCPPVPDSITWGAVGPAFGFCDSGTICYWWNGDNQCFSDEPTYCPYAPINVTWGGFKSSFRQGCPVGSTCYNDGGGDECYLNEEPCPNLPSNVSPTTVVGPAIGGSCALFERCNFYDSSNQCFCYDSIAAEVCHGYLMSNQCGAHMQQCAETCSACSSQSFVRATNFLDL
ncbi:unnamed protein product, partial [Mesorhabditis belari]|uniref:ShKT domain-containing protein n=1 Tax=Mesorhabditis belari TaxID=2138241 RepID=A0AAF3ECE8_9BILA